MNRIILIGNGFDLAHGLDTRYSDFIDWFWKNQEENYNDNVTSTEEMGVFNKSNVFFKFQYMPIGQLSNGWLEECLKENKIVFRNKFLEVITSKVGLKNWVDIEEEYNDLLHKTGTKYALYQNIDDLNKDFSMIKEELEKYLIKTTIQCDNKNPKPEIHNAIYSIFDLKDFTQVGIDNIVEEECQRLQQIIEGKRFPSGNEHYLLKGLKDNKKPLKNEVIRELLIDETNSFNPSFHLLPKQILFLNFNYTNTQSKYYGIPMTSREIDSVQKEIHIHGELGNQNNPIIFGYGDELADKYNELQDKNDNRYLKNIKSIRYLETANYKKLLDFIDSDKYQIFIMGHSCGNSDRTLLNTLFEHENCVSVKPFYYQYKDKKTDETKDDYSDKVMNISRNFTDKKMMREKVVNKTYCKPLLSLKTK